MMNENLIAEELRNCGPCTLPSFSYSLRNATRCCIHPDSGDSNRREPQSVHRNAGLRFPDFSLPYDTSVTYIKTYNRAIRGGSSVSSQHIHFHQPDGFFPFPPSKPKRQQSFPESNQPNKNSDSGKTERYQMKKIAYLGMLAVASSLMIGCASTNQTKDSLNEFLIGSRNAEVIEKTNDKGIDAIADSSTIIYRRVGVSMREYIEKTHGGIATIAVAKAILHNGDKAGLKQAKKEFRKLPEEKRKNLTVKELFEAGKDSAALDAYKESCKGNKVKRTDLIPRGKKVYQEKLAKENWNTKIIEMQKIADDLAKISQNMNVLAQDIAAKITAKSNDIAALAQNPVMQEFVKETAPMLAKKSFANAAKKKEIDAEIARITALPKYKPIMDKKAQYTAELEKLQKDSKVLSDGIGKQIAYTGKAVPFLLEAYNDMKLMNDNSGKTQSASAN